VPRLENSTDAGKKSEIESSGYSNRSRAEAENRTDAETEGSEIKLYGCSNRSRAEAGNRTGTGEKSEIESFGYSNRSRA